MEFYFRLKLTAGEEQMVSSMWTAMGGIFSVWGHGGSGVGVKLEVGSACVKPLKMLVGQP